MMKPQQTKTTTQQPAHQEPRPTTRRHSLTTNTHAIMNGPLAPEPERVELPATPAHKHPKTPVQKANFQTQSDANVNPKRTEFKPNKANSQVIRRSP
jgi:hypothetical protein